MEKAFNDNAAHSSDPDMMQECQKAYADLSLSLDLGEDARMAGSDAAKEYATFREALRKLEASVDERVKAGPKKNLAAVIERIQKPT